MKLFAYGTLLDENIQKNIIGHLVEGVPEYLSGYRKTSRQFSSGIYPDLVEDVTCEISGRILDLTADVIDQCDKYEGDDYRRVNLKSKSGVEVFVYRS